MIKSVLVAVPTYDDKAFTDLPMAGQAAATLANGFEVGGYSVIDRGLLTGGEHQVLNDKLDQALEQVSCEDTLVLYWTGHGCPEPDGFYLACQNTKSTAVDSGNTIDARRFGKKIVGADAEKTLVIMDTCHSGQGASEIIATINSILETFADAPGRERAIAVIASANAREYAEEALFSEALHTVLTTHQASTPWSDHDAFLTPDQIAVATKRYLSSSGYEPAIEQMARGLGQQFVPNPRYQPSLGAEDVETRWLHASLADGVEHFAQASRGIEVGETGWYFTGRVRLLCELVTWLHSGEGSLRIVTGPPGAGKSAILGRIATLSDAYHRGLAEKAGILANAPDGTVPREGIVDVSIHAKGKTLDDCLRVLCTGLDIPLEGTVHLDVNAIVSAVGEMDRQVVILIDALDEAAGAQAPSIVHSLIRPLVRLANVLLLVGSRRSLDGKVIPESEDRHGRLIEAFCDGVTLHDLEDEPSRREDIEAYVRHRLGASKYPHSEDEMAEAAREVARRADGSFLYARVVSRTLQEQERLECDLPANALDAFVSDLHARFPNDEQRVDDLLNALAWGLGRGLTRRVWASIASALSQPDTAHTDVDVAWVLANVGWHIIEAGEDGQAVYRLAHQAFTDYYQGRMEVSDAHGRIVVALAEGISGADWLDTDRYLWRNLPRHAAIAGHLDDLIADPGLLSVVEPVRLVEALNSRRTDKSSSIPNIYRRVADRLRDLSPIERMPLIHMTAMIEAPELASNIEPPVPTAWRCRWTQARPSSTHIAMGRHEGPVFSVALGEVDGRSVVVSGGFDGMVRLWDARSGAKIGEPLEGHDYGVTSIALGQVDGRSVIVSGGFDGMVRLWDAHSGVPIGEPLEGHDLQVLSVAIGDVGGRSVVVSGGTDGTVRLWDAHSGAVFGKPLEGHSGVIHSVALGEVNGRSVVVSGSENGTVRLWDAHFGVAVGEPLDVHNGVVHSVALGEVNGASVVVSGGEDGIVRLWDAHSSAGIGEPFEKHGSSVLTVAIGKIIERAIVVSGSWNGAIRLRDARSGEPIGEQFEGHGDWVRSVALGEVDGRPVLVSGCDDQTVRLWDVHSSTSFVKPLGEHNSWVNAVAIGMVDERSVVVSGGQELKVRLWDAGSGSAIGQPLEGQNSWVNAVALGEISGRTVVVSGGDNGAVALWDAHSGAPLGNLLEGHDRPVMSIAPGEVDGRSIVVSGSRDGTVRLWDAHSGAAIREPLQGHAGQVFSVAFGEVDGRPIVVSGGQGGRVHLWDARSGAALAAPIKAHYGWVHSVALGEVDGRSVVVSGGDDKKVRLWDAHCSEAIGEPLEGHDDWVTTVALGQANGQSVIVSGSRDRTIRLWQVPLERRSTVFSIGEIVLSIAQTVDNMFAVGTDRGLLLVDLSSSQS